MNVKAEKAGELKVLKLMTQSELKELMKGMDVRTALSDPKVQKLTASLNQMEWMLKVI